MIKNYVWNKFIKIWKLVVIGLSSKINIAKFRHITIIPKVHSIASLSETMQIFAKEKKLLIQNIVLKQVADKWMIVYINWHWDGT